jgi:hypothetical protein
MVKIWSRRRHLLGTFNCAVSMGSIHTYLGPTNKLTVRLRTYYIGHLAVALDFQANRCADLSYECVMGSGEEDVSLEFGPRQIADNSVDDHHCLFHEI